MTALKVEDLTTSFRTREGWRAAVDGVSFELGRNETLAIVGESGSGKSVTALSIMRLLPGHASRVSGSVQLDGRELAALDETEMERLRGREIAMIFQEPMTSLNPVMTIGRQIGETITRHRGFSEEAAAAETLRLLERVRIPAANVRMNDYPHQLSGGMLQRTMIAMALACAPKVLIADEPTTALDVTIQAQILQLIRELQREDGMAVLFITHDMGVVAEIADRTAVMRRAKLVEINSTANIFANPREDYTRSLIAAVPRLGSRGGKPPLPPSAIIGRAGGQESASARLSAAGTGKPQPVLSVKNLVTRFDIKSGLFGRVKARIHAVENVSFDLHAGETLAIVGESGSGKSTIGRSVLRLAAPASGSIQVDGEDVLALAGEELTRRRQRMQMVFQDPMSSLNPRMRIGETLIEPLLAHRLCSKGEAQERAAVLLRRVGLDPDMMKRYPHQFSGGQKQRICIARALALRPSLIIADEAVSALDVAIKAQVIDLLMELQKELDLALLFISHDIAAVERISHRVAVMYLGEIVEIGPREAVLGNPQHAYTKRLLDAVPAADPSQRRRIAEASEMPSPLRDPAFAPPKRIYKEIAPGHLVQAA